MSTTTRELGLIKPELTDPADITALNENWELIDARFREISETYGSLYGEHNIDALKKDIAHYMSVYTSLEQIGLTPGSETIEEIVTKLPNYSRLVLTVGEGMNSSIYPDSNYGLLVVEKTVNSRVVFTFINNQGKEWIGVYSRTSNGDTWTGWGKTYSEHTTCEYLDIADGITATKLGKVIFINFNIRNASYPALTSGSHILGKLPVGWRPKEHIFGIRLTNLQYTTDLFGAVHSTGDIHLSGKQSTTSVLGHITFICG